MENVTGNTRRRPHNKQRLEMAKIQATDYEKAAAVMHLVDLIIVSFESGFVDKNTLTLAQLHRVAENHCADEYDTRFGSIVERHGEELANRCGTSYAPSRG